MLDLVAVVTAGGIILWASCASHLNQNELINHLMQKIIIEGTFVENIITYNTLSIQWCKSIEMNLIFLAAYPKVLPVSHVPLLLEHIETFWKRNYIEELKKEPFRQITEFDQVYPILLKRSLEIEKESRKSHGTGARTVNKKKNSTGTSKAGKELRDWGDKVNDRTMQQLDLSKSTLSVDTPSQPHLFLTENSDQIRELDWNISPVEADTSNKSTGLWKYFDQITGQKDLSKEDLVEPLNKIRLHLINKNVASDVADFICNSIETTLVGKRIGPLVGVTQLVKEATESAVSRILTPHASIDLLEEVRRITKEQKRPYVMTFVGVNGVGKSTNLSKVCFWLLQNKLRILIVAGDTFRSGAVEQLRTHVRNLSSASDAADIRLYERGYGKDAAVIAKEAINTAKKENFDIVLIDTAGRMQDNDSLMRELAKLVYVAQPDKLIFVGEALVGNEAVDQLRKFNLALSTYAPSAANIITINGILLTKFDTIDDKVGAALSMTFIANAPILFVGVGQTYTDLRKLNVRAVLTSLFK